MKGHRLNGTVMMPICTVHYYLCAKSLLSCKTDSSVSSREVLYGTKILTYFMKNALVLVGNMDLITFTVYLNVFILILPALQISVRPKQKKHHLNQIQLYIDGALQRMWHGLLLNHLN